MRHLSLLLIGTLGALQAQAGDLKDPTRPPLVVVEGPLKQAAAAPLLPQVSAIFISSTRRVAVVDGQPVRAGDQVGAFHIEEVTAQGVRYSSAGHSAFAPLAVVHPFTQGSVP